MTLVTKRTTFPLILVCLIGALNTGCATRALMSSDRYEKPAETQYQDQSLHNKNKTLMAQQYAAYQLKADSISPLNTCLSVPTRWIHFGRSANH